MLKKKLSLQASFLGLCIPSLFVPALAHSQTAVTSEVVVTVTREALPVSKLGQAVDVLTDADIKSYQSLSIADLLSHTTDISLTRNGGPGATATASLRGAGADHTLYLLDGVALNDPSQVGGGVDLGLLSTGDISRIEVLRGPLSTLWGSGALGGVVSLTSRQATRPLEGDLSIEGLDRYGSARLGVGGKSDGLTWRLAASGLNDQGISAFDRGSEKDGFAQTDLSARFSYALSDSTTLRALAFKTHNRSDIDGYAPPTYAFGDTAEFSKSDSQLYALGLTNRYGHGEQTLSLSASQTYRDLHDPDGTPNYVARGRITAVDYHLSYRFSEATRLLAGVKYEHDDMQTESVYSPLSSKAMSVSSVYGQIAQDLGTASLTASARHDDSSSFGGQDIAQLAVSLPASANLRFHASAGQGVKIPSLYQLYGDYGFSGLKPETALSIDGGADYIYGSGQVTFNLFTREVRDLIDFDSTTFTYRNIARSKANGAEIEWVQSLSDQWKARGNYSVLNTRNESSGLTGKHLARKPSSMGSLDLTYAAMQKLNLGLGLRFAGQSFDDAFNTVRLKAYTLADLRADYALNDRVGLYARLENVTDAHYETAAGYGQLGRRLWLGVHTRVF